MSSITSIAENRRGHGVVGWLSLGAGVVLAAILVLSALATSQQNAAGSANVQISAAAGE